MNYVRLLLSRRFGPIFGCMALGAFNDNFYKNALIILITYVLSADLGKDPAVLISFAAACFILPFFLFSGIAGQIADRYAKHHLVRVFKATELVLCLLAGVALIANHLSSLMVLLFLFGVQAAFFGPVKYAIIPELLKKNELLAGNGMVEAGTFLCILVGTLTGGLLVLHPLGAHMVAWIMVMVSLLGLSLGLRVPMTKAAQPQLVLDPNIFRNTKAMLAHAISHPPILFAILGISWFWAIGATYLTQIPVFTKEVVGGNEEVVSLYLALFSVGIGLGALSCQKLMKHRTVRKITPLALIGVCFFGLDLCWTAHGLPAPDGLSGLDVYFDSFAHYRLAFDLMMIAACGGTFIVPLYTQLQLKSSDAHRARAIASNNVFNALFTAVAAILAAAFFWWGWHILRVLFFFAALNLPVIYYLWRHSDWAD